MMKEVTLDQGIKLTVPEGLAPKASQGVDSRVSTLRGRGISLLIDHGPFADTLMSYAGRSGYRSTEEVIDGRPARIVSFDESDGTRVVAAHFDGAKTGQNPQERLTTVINLDPKIVGEEAALSIIRSTKFGGR